MSPVHFFTAMRKKRGTIASRINLCDCDDRNSFAVVVVVVAVMYIHAMKLNNLSEGSLINNILFHSSAIHFAWLVPFLSFIIINIESWLLAFFIVIAPHTFRSFAPLSSRSVSFPFCVAMKLMLPFIILLLLYIFKHTELSYEIY